MLPYFLSFSTHLYIFRRSFLCIIHIWFFSFFPSIFYPLFHFYAFFKLFSDTKIPSFSCHLFHVAKKCSTKIHNKRFTHTWKCGTIFWINFYHIISTLEISAHLGSLFWWPVFYISSIYSICKSDTLRNVWKSFLHWRNNKRNVHCILNCYDKLSRYDFPIDCWMIYCY